MSFGFSIGDFVALGKLTWTICDRCKSSATEFKDLSREVSSMHFVLKAIECSWAISDLASDQRYELSSLAEGCQEVLKDLERLLDKYQSLGSNWKNPLDRFRWAATKIAPLRSRLLHSCVYLSTFNTTLASSLHSDCISASEAIILQKLNEMQLEFQEGKRAAPAFSLITPGNINQEKTWQNVSAELESVGLGAQSLSSNQDFICSWIDKVMLADVDEGIDEIPRTLHNSPGGSVSGRSEKPPDSASSTPIAPALNIESMSSEPTPGHRPESAGSHRSKDSSWRPVDQPNPSYVQNLLKKIFNLEYGDSDVLPMQRVYNQMDWRDRGYLTRVDIEHHFLQAMRGSSFSLTNKTLMGLIKANDTDQSGRIDREGFVRICIETLHLRIEKYIGNAILKGGREARLEWEWLSTIQNEYLPLPDRVRQEYLNASTGFLSPSKTTSDPRTFGSMAFTTARIIVPRFNLALERLSLKEASKELIRSCDLVREAALQFTILEGEDGPTKTNDLDAIMAATHAVPHAEKEFRKFPDVDLDLAQQVYYELIRSIQGFVSSLGCPKLRDRELFDPVAPFKLPTDDQWQKNYMSSFVRRIAAQAKECERFAHLIRLWREWWIGPYSSRTRRSFHQGRMALKKIRECQLDAMESATCRLRIDSIDVAWFERKRRIFRSQPPPCNIYAKIAIDGHFPAHQYRAASSRTKLHWTYEQFEDFFCSRDCSLTLTLSVEGHDVDSTIAEHSWDLNETRSQTRMRYPKPDTYAATLIIKKGHYKGVEIDVKVELQRIEIRAWSHPGEPHLIQSCPCPVGWHLSHTEDDNCYFYPYGTHSGSCSKTVLLPASKKIDANGLRLPEGWTRERTKDGVTIYHLPGKTGSTQLSTPLHQGQFAKEAAPKSSDIQLLERDFERENAIIEWDTDIYGSILTGAWVRRQEKDSGDIYYANLNTGELSRGLERKGRLCLVSMNTGELKEGLGDPSLIEYG